MSEKVCPKCGSELVSTEPSTNWDNATWYLFGCNFEMVLDSDGRIIETLDDCECLRRANELLESKLTSALARAESAEAREAELSKHLEWVLEEAEKAHMGYPSPAEEWFALRDSAKAVLSSDGGSAMLDRLRSAEAVCKFLADNNHGLLCESGDKAEEFNRLIEEWQKAGGDS